MSRDVLELLERSASLYNRALDNGFLRSLEVDEDLLKEMVETIDGLEAWFLRTDNLSLAESVAREYAILHSVLRRGASGDLLRKVRARPEGLDNWIARKLELEHVSEAPIHQLAKFLRSSPDAIKLADGKPYQISEQFYLTEVLGELYRNTRRAIDGTRRVGNRIDGHGDFADDDVGAAQYGRRIFNYPYFLTKARQELFGVIQWGWQTSLGLFIHLNHPLYSELAHSPTPELLCKAVETTLDHEGNIFGVRGFVQIEILKDLLARTSGLEIRARLDSRIKIAGSFTETPIARAMVNPKPSEYHLGFFDPGAPEKSPVYKDLTVPHGMEIPVGLGFSLPMLPALLRDDAWGRIKKLCLAHTAQHAEALKRHGIEPFADDRGAACGGGEVVIPLRRPA